MQISELGKTGAGHTARTGRSIVAALAALAFPVLMQTLPAVAQPGWGSPQPTCKADGSETEISAPRPREAEPFFSTDPKISAKLRQRQTINVAGPWLDRESHDVKDYGVVWHSWDKSPGGDAIWMREILWVHFKYERLDTSFRHHVAGLESFMTDEPWQTLAEYGTSYRLAFEDPAYPDYLARTVEQMLAQTGSDGVFFDWWIDNQPYLTEAKVNGARNRIAKAVRSRIGPGPVILGNVGWSRDASTHDDLNGVFMELWKKPSDRGYSCAELLRVEDLLVFHDQKLAQPKIVVLEPWRQARKSSSSDRKSKTNLKWASMFTAMAAVVPRNGYILYSDNARDRKSDDHGHYFYDFYEVDLGGPTSGYTPVARGIGYKLFEKGMIAYNATPKKADVRIEGRLLRLEPLSGVFCRPDNDRWDCEL